MFLTNYLKFKAAMKIDLIYDTNGDWAALYVDGICRFQGHHIRDEDFMTLLSELGAQVNDYEEADMTNYGSGAPLNLSEIRANE